MGAGHNRALAAQRGSLPRCMPSRSGTAETSLGTPLPLTSRSGSHGAVVDDAAAGRSSRPMTSSSGSHGAVVDDAAADPTTLPMTAR